jgi:hypothetical protein
LRDWKQSSWAFPTIQRMEVGHFSVQVIDVTRVISRVSQPSSHRNGSTPLW